MKTNIEKKITLPKKGFINELALEAGCNRKTVHRALYEGYQGKKSDLVRSLFQEKYGFEMCRENNG